MSKLSLDELSEDGNQKITAMHKIIDNLESIAHLCYQMGLTIERKNENNAWFTQELRNNLKNEFDLVNKSLSVMVNNLERDYNEVEIENTLESEFRKMSIELKKSYLDEIKNEKLPDKSGAFYNDIVSLYEKIGQFVLNINQAIYNTRSKTNFKDN
jgi:phosphate:Na+ symporter